MITQNQTPAWAMDDPKAGLKVLTQKLGEGKVDPNKLSLAFAKAQKEFAHVTPQFVTNFLKASMQLPVATEFANDMYLRSLRVLGVNGRVQTRSLELFQIALICGMFVHKSQEEVILDIKKSSGLTYHPQRKTLQEISTFVSGHGSALAKFWR